MPALDSPEILGLHPNADLTYRLAEARTLLDILLQTRPKRAAGGAGDEAEAGASRDETVAAKVQDMLGSLPDDFNFDLCLHASGKMGGVEKPLNVFLYHELESLQAVMQLVAATMDEMVQVHPRDEGQVGRADTERQRETLRFGGLGRISGTKTF